MAEDGAFGAVVAAYAHACHCRTDGIVRTDAATAAVLRTMHSLACVNRAGRAAAGPVLAKQPAVDTEARVERALRAAVVAGPAAAFDLAATYLDDDAGWAYLSRVFGDHASTVLGDLAALAAAHSRTRILRACLRRNAGTTSMGTVFLNVRKGVTDPVELREMWTCLRGMDRLAAFRVWDAPPQVARCRDPKHRAREIQGCTEAWAAQLSSWIGEPVSMRHVVLA